LVSAKKEIVGVREYALDTEAILARGEALLGGPA